MAGGNGKGGCVPENPVTTALPSIRIAGTGPPWARAVPLSAAARPSSAPAPSNTAAAAMRACWRRLAATADQEALRLEGTIGDGDMKALRGLKRLSVIGRGGPPPGSARSAPEHRSRGSGGGVNLQSLGWPRHRWCIAVAEMIMNVCSWWPRCPAAAPARARRPYLIHRDIGRLDGAAPFFDFARHEARQIFGAAAVGRRDAHAETFETLAH